MDKSQTDLAYFKSIPWCAEHLNRKDTTIWLPPYKAHQSQEQEDTFINVTLNTPSTFSQMVCFYHGTSSSLPSSSSETQSPPPPPPITEFKTLISLSHNLTGYPGLAHGGLILTVLDEVLGLHGRLNHQRGTNSATSMTGSLNTKFIRGVPVPGVVLVVSRIVRIEGRKCFMGARMEGEGGVLYAVAEAVFVVLKGNL